jgi:DNA (cytosine-5)-methyltransferase 1
MNCLSLFSGIGGFDLGFERAGIQTIAMCEADSIARNILRKHWPDVPVIEDVSDLDGREYRTVDIVSGGFPCQDISVAGNREGLAGSKSGLWWEFYRIVSESMPKWVVIENVAGLMSSGGRRDLGAIIGSLGELGYLGGYRVLDARYFGVAQRRRRMFIVGSLGNNGGQKVFFESEGLPGDLEKSRQEGKKNSGAALQSSSESSKLLAESGVVGSLTKSFGGAGADAQHAQNGWLVPVAFAKNQRSEVIYTDLSTLSTGGGKPGQGYPAVICENHYLGEVSGTVTDSFGPKNFSNNQEVLRGSIFPVTAYSITPKSGGGNNLRVSEIDHSNSLTAIGQHHDRGTKILDNLGVRRLTPVECERLMGLPDNWTKFGADGKVVADSHRYRFCGNAVVSNVAEWLGNRIVAVDQGFA